MQMARFAHGRSADAEPEPRSTIRNRRPPPGAVRLLLAGVVASTVGLTAHHALPLANHTVETVALIIFGATLVAMAAARLALRREVAALPAVVILTPGSVAVETARHDDLVLCTALHHSELEHGFFTRLGPRFLEAYHATFIDSPHAVSRIATIGGHPVGFVAGLIRPRAHARWVLRRRGARLALLGALALLARPLAALRFARTRVARYARTWRRHRREAPQGAQPGRSGLSEPAVLSHVAVLPGARGTGAGRRLTAAFAEAAREAGAERAALVTLAGFAGAGGFYERLGWCPGPIRPTPDGRSIQE